MSNNDHYGERRHVFATHDTQAIEVKIDAWGSGLTKEEAVLQADEIASEVMKIIAERTRYINIPLSRIEAKRKRFV